MILGQVFERFVEESPVSVMVRGLLEKILSPEKLDALFERSTENQYTRELLFSTVVEMMNSVTCGIRPSIHAAYQARASQMSVSITSVYNQLNAMESQVSAELLRETSEEWSYLGEVDGGQIWEQIVVVSDDDGYLSTIRRVKVFLEEETRDGDLSIFILTNLPISGRGMMIAIPSQEWQVFAQMSFSELTEVLRDLANHVNLATLLRHTRAPKKIRRRCKRTRPVKRPHISTAKILSQNQTKKSTP